jgi:hypothetical protein
MPVVRALHHACADRTLWTPLSTEDMPHDFHSTGVAAAGSSQLRAG